jgi:hypothetical protein
MLKDYVRDQATELWSKHKHQVKYVAVAAAIGAVVAIPVPGIGPNGGAIIGALAGLAILIRKHVAEIGSIPRQKTVAEQVLELNELLSSGKLTKEQHQLLVANILHPR